MSPTGRTNWHKIIVLWVICAYSPLFAAVAGDSNKIRSTSAVYTADTITFTINFTKPIAPYNVSGWIDLDTDQDASTGEESYRKAAGTYPSPDLGDEYEIEFNQYMEPGLKFAKVLIAWNNQSVATVPITYGKQKLSISVPIRILEGCTGPLNYAVVIQLLDDSSVLEAPIGTKELPSTPAAHS